MAKLVLYLATNDMRRASTDAISAAISFSNGHFAKKESLHCSVMQPREDDVLAIPGNSAFLKKLSLVLEIWAPAGKPLSSMRESLFAQLSPLLSHVDAENSSVLAATPRVFQNNGHKQQRYHYLMVKADHFSSSDYLDYYMNSHYRFGIVTPLANYVQNYIDAESTAEFAAQLGMKGLPFDNFSELQFADINEYLRCEAILEAGPAASQDETLFVNRERCQSFSMDVVFDSQVS